MTDHDHVHLIDEPDVDFSNRRQLPVSVAVFLADVKQVIHMQTQTIKFFETQPARYYAKPKVCTVII
jgi:hypothetical protein